MTTPTATWRVTIEGPVWLVSDTNGRIVAEGSGPLPDLRAVAVIFPPPDPPITTTLPPDVEDTSTFIWPPQPPFRPDKAEQRYASLGEGLYAGATTFPNPLPGSHKWAGTIAQGRIGGWDLAGYDLWAPGDAKPELIRRALKVGHI